VMVTTSMPAEGFFSAAFGMDEGTIDTTATAGILSVGEHCVLALSDTLDQAIDMSGSAVVTLDCGIASNSNSDQSIYLNGNVTVTADPSLQAFGDIYEGGSSTLNIPNPIQPFSQKVADPYADLTVPSTPSTCSDLPPSFNRIGDDDRFDAGTETFTLEPGRYCGDLDLTYNGRTQAKIELDPGVYIIDGGDLNFGSNADITGDGVTLILTGDDPSDIGVVDLQGQGRVNLTAPSTGDYAGVALYQDRAAEYGDMNRINGGADFQINGVVYFPSQQLDFRGNADAAGTCMMIIGQKVSMGGIDDTTIVTDDATCTALGVKKPARTLVTLVE